MQSTYRVLEPDDVESPTAGRDSFALDVYSGLTCRAPYLPSKYFYDDIGSALFAKITDLEEYYPTRCEFEIVRERKQQFADLVGSEPFNLVELGAGDGRKTKVLLEHLLSCDRDFRYIPIDISESAMKGLTESLKAQLPELSVEGLVSEYFNAIAWLRQQPKRRNVVLFLGSNIGNFPSEEARRFLIELWHSLAPEDLLFSGFDLKKDPHILQQAYCDSKGLTRDFNLNLLTRINRELQGNFDITSFVHVPRYNFATGAMESFLTPKISVTLHLGAIGRDIDIPAWQGIYTECSYKYSHEQIREMAEQTGFEVVETLTDSQEWFADSLWRVVK